MIEKRLAQTALTRPVIMPLVYRVSNLNINTMPVIINNPARISSFEIFVLLIRGSSTAVNKVMLERQTSVTGTVDSLMEAKKSTQWAPTKAPVNISFRKVFRSTLMAVLLNLKYKNSEINAINTRYHTSWTAEIVMSAPKIPVNPHIKTVKWSMIRFLFGPAEPFFVTILELLKVNNKQKCQKIS